MSTGVAGFSRHEHLNELRDPLDSQEGFLSPDERRRRVLENLGLTAGVAATAIATMAADELVVPPDAIYVAKTTGGVAEALTLANGQPGHVITISLVVAGVGDATLTPATASGFATIVFADAGDQASLLYVNDTVGWVLLGTAGVAAPPVITV